MLQAPKTEIYSEKNLFNTGFELSLDAMTWGEGAVAHRAARMDRNNLLIDLHLAQLWGCPVPLQDGVPGGHSVRWRQCGAAHAATSSQLPLGSHGCCCVASRADGRYTSRVKVQGEGAHSLLQLIIKEEYSN